MCVFMAVVPSISGERGRMMSRFPFRTHRVSGICNVYIRDTSFVRPPLSSGDHILYFLFLVNEGGKSGGDTVVRCRRRPYGTIQGERAENQNAFAEDV